jgi:hypothetical protein
MSSQLEPIFAGGKSSLRMAHSLPVSRCGLIEGLGSSTSSPELEFRLPTVDALRAALPGLEKRRAFVPDATGIAMQQPCDLVLVHPEGGARLAIRAEVVWVQPDGPGKGIGVELKALDVAKLRAFVGGPAEKPAEPPPPEEPATDARHADVDDADATDGPPDRAKGLYDKIRAMTTRERETCARSGALSERVALERCYGASVWEGLLHNPQITPQTAVGSPSAKSNAPCSPIHACQAPRSIASSAPCHRPIFAACRNKPPIARRCDRPHSDS